MVTFRRKAAEKKATVHLNTWIVKSINYGIKGISPRRLRLVYGVQSRWSASGTQLDLPIESDLDPQ